MTTHFLHTISVNESVLAGGLVPFSEMQVNTKWVSRPAVANGCISLGHKARIINIDSARRNIKYEYGGKIYDNSWFDFQCKFYLICQELPAWTRQ